MVPRNTAQRCVTIHILFIHLLFLLLLCFFPCQVDGTRPHPFPPPLPGTLFFCVGCVILLLSLCDPSLFSPFSDSDSVLPWCACLCPLCVGCVVIDPSIGHRTARFLFVVSSLSLPSSCLLAFRLVFL